MKIVTLIRNKDGRGWKFKSKSELKRALKAVSVEVNHRRIYNPKYILRKGDLIRIGKGRFIRAI